MNITDAIWRRMHEAPGHTAIVQAGRPITYGGLRDATERLVTRLVRLGIGAGDCVAVSFMQPSAHVSLVLAIARMGAVYVPFQSNWPDGRKDELARRHRIVKWFRDDHDAWVSSALEAHDHVSVATLFGGLESERPSVQMPPAGREDEPWRVAFSSGTTGSPKSIPWTHRSGHLLQALLMGTYECRVGSRLLVFAGIGIGLSLGHSMLQLAGGGTVLYPASAKPADLFRLFRTHQPTAILTSTQGATLLIAHLDSHPADGVDLPGSLRSITLGGSVVPPALAEAIRRRICPNLQVTYGSTEVGTIALADPETTAAAPGSAGRVMPWIEAQALDGEGQVLPPGMSGLLRFRSPAMASGYLGDPEAHDKAFRAGWFYPGDTGAIDERGYLTLGARADHLINLHGVKMDPVLIEQVLCSDPAVRDAAVAAVDTPRGGRALVAAVVSEAGKAVPAERLQALCLDRIGAQARFHRILALVDLPRTPAGKLDRPALAETLGELVRPSQTDASGATPSA